METEVLNICEESLQKAALFLQDGQVVAMPTETVYGLAANAFCQEAIEKIFAAKARPQDNPLIVHIASFEDLYLVASNIPKKANILAKAFWPGPLSIIVPRRQTLAPNVSGGLLTVGVRMPAHPAARRLIKAAGVPLAAPSANMSGSPSPTSAAHVLQDMQGRIPLILDGGICPVGVESTVISLAGVPTVLRPGFVTPDEIATVLQEDVLLAPGAESPPQDGFIPESPGMKYKHYSPKAEITIIDANFEGFSQFVLNQKNEQGIFALCFDEEGEKLTIPAVTYGKKNDAKSQAAGLFCALRELDERGAKIVYARKPNTKGVGLAVRNRLLRAAGFREIVP